MNTKVFFRQAEAKFPSKNKAMEDTKKSCAYTYFRCSRLISMMFAFILISVVIPTIVIADAELGEQHCGDPNCLGKILDSVLPPCDNPCRIF